jgi:UDP-N-acetyl-D-mannosaminuronic acid dehydrogenase
MRKNRKLVVFGMGYIGLPTAIKFAESGYDVLGIDTSVERVNALNNGHCPILEQGLSEALNNVIAKKYLTCSTQVQSADVFIIAVPTPIAKDEFKQVEADLTYVFDVCKEIAKVIEPENMVVLESTSPVGTTEKIYEFLFNLAPGFKDAPTGDPKIHVAYCPERVIPGNMLTEIVYNDRIIGGLTAQSTELAKKLYQSFVKGSCWKTDSRTAEMCKLTENSFRDVEIAFANELSLICDDLSLNVWELIELANRHPRVNILQPGPGVGGHCIAVDPWFIISSESKHTTLIKTARNVNDSKPNWVIQKVKTAIKEVKDEHGIFEHDILVALYGLTYKANVEDLRESPALKIALELINDCTAKTVAIDKFIDDPSDLGLEVMELSEANACADIAVLLVDHDYFKKTYPTSAKKIIDTRGIWVK